MSDDEPDLDDFESAPVHSLEAILSPHFRRVCRLHIRAFYALVASALGDETRQPTYGRVIMILASLIDVLSRSSISVFTSTLFDSILAAAEMAAWGDGGTRCRCMLDLARVIDYAFPPSGLVDSGYAQRAVEAARHAALEERRNAAGLVADAARGGDGAWAEVPFNGTTQASRQPPRSGFQDKAWHEYCSEVPRS